MKWELKLDDYNVKNIIRALIKFENQIIVERIYTDAVDDLLIKLCDY